MIKHDLIEQVGGIEKAKAIVEGAPFGTHYRVDTGEVICCHNENHFYFADLVKLGVEFIRIDDLRTAIAEYDGREFKVGDLVVKTHPKNTILWPVLGVYKNGGVWLDYKGFCWKPPRIRHATPEEIAAGHRLEAERHG